MKSESRNRRIEQLVGSLTTEQVREEILQAKIKVKYKDVDLLREVCKLPSVRRKFAVARYNGRPFWDVDGKDLNPAQVRILQWLKLYDNVDESIDRPPDRIVYNDKLLRGWLEEQQKKQENRYEENWRGETGSVGKRATDHQEVFEFED